MGWTTRVVRAGMADVALHDRPGTAPVLFGVHGNSGDHRSFVPLVDHPALVSHAAVLLDLPGHGHSPRVPLSVPRRYGIDFVARVIDAAINHLEDGPVIALGHSLGGHLLLQALARGLIRRVAGVAVFGTPPLASLEAVSGAFGGEHAMRCVFAGALTRSEAELWAAESFHPGTSPDWFIDGVLATDPDARLALGASLATELRDEVRTLDESPIPVALLHPIEDRLVRREHMTSMTGRALWRGRVQEIPSVGHHGHWQASDAFVELISSFARDATAGHPPHGGGGRQGVAHVTAP